MYCNQNIFDRRWIIAHTGGNYADRSR
jgi:hypothetical protein